MITLEDFIAHFAKAKKTETLEFMVRAQVRDMRLIHDPSRHCARLTAQSYKKLGHTRACNMLMASYMREKELEGANAKAEPGKTEASRLTMKPKIRPATEQEVTAWFAKEAKKMPKGVSI